MLEFLGIATGMPDEVRQLYKDAAPIFKKLQDLQLRKAVASDNMTRKLYHDGRLEDELVPKEYKRSDSFDSTFSNDHPQEYKNLLAKCRDFKKELNNQHVYKRLESAFKILAERRKRESKYISLYYITEQSMVDHFHLVFGQKCDILARVLYIKLARRKDHAKINFVQFAEAFVGLLHEVKDKRNRTIFNLLEFNGDGEYDIMYLFQLLVNVPRNTMFGQEVLKLTKEYKDKNVLKKGGFTQ